MRVSDYFEYGEILDGVEQKILFQSKVQELKKMDCYISANHLLNTFLANATASQFYVDGINFVQLFKTQDGRYIVVDWQDGRQITITEIFLPRDETLED